QSGYELAFAAHADLRAAMVGTIDGVAVQDEALVGQRWEWEAQQGQIYELRKLVAVVTSRDTLDPSAEAQRILRQLVEAGGAALLVSQNKAWAAPRAGPEAHT